jgi:hypothetical protein
MLLEPISIFTWFAFPLSGSWGVFWAQQPMWFFYVQVVQGFLTLLADRSRNLALKILLLTLTFPALPWLSWVTEINIYGQITLTFEYRVFNQIFLVLPYTIVQLGYAFFILRSWIKDNRNGKAEQLIFESGDT